MAFREYPLNENSFGPVAAKTAAFTVGADGHSVYDCDATGAAFAATLPAAASVDSGRAFTVKKTDASANAVTITRAGTDTIDGATTKACSAQYEGYTVVSDGSSKWHIVA